MSRFKQFLFMFIAVVLLIVMVQNAQKVTFRFLNWQYEVSQLLMVLIVFVLAFVLGFATAKWPRRKQDDFTPTPTQR
ncbi:MAG: LapA family protein [Candidatus Krumholzibacteria bacterium]|nr:LapA family protein [Candidatus Krumholzibacteria bacterium]MDH4336715.1 LapA family protein [Candidatus Krumholzibacteria bacterium]MDH5270742.1 LapA family protein [Candidatus Krumholzibacteria bacterium]